MSGELDRLHREAEQGERSPLFFATMADTFLSVGRMTEAFLCIELAYTTADQRCRMTELSATVPKASDEVVS